MRIIHAIGHSELGSFLDYQGDPVAVLVSPEGNVFLGESVIPDFPLASVISADRVPRFVLVPPPSFGAGWVLQLKYGGDVETKLPLGQWTGTYYEILAWLAQANHLVGVEGLVRDTVHMIRDGAISRIIARGTIRAIPGWAISFAAGINGDYKLPWMDVFLDNIGKILAVKFNTKTVPKAEFVKREIHETWLSVFNRLLPRIARQRPDRAIEICFEPLFHSSARGQFDVVRIGYLTSFSVLFKTGSSRLKAFQDELHKWKSDADLGTAKYFTAASAESNFEKYLDIFKRTVLSGSGKSRIKVHSQVGTISNELVIDLVSEGQLLSRLRSDAGDAHKLVDEIKKAEDFVVFCDTILRSDIERRWDESGEAEELAEILFPLPERIHVGLPYASGDDEWGAVLREALLAVARDKREEIRQSWLDTIRHFENASIHIADEFQQVTKELVNHE